MLETFKARLKAKSTAAGANLSTTRINAIAERLHKKFPEITEEKDHDAKIEDNYDDDELKDIAKTDDRLRTLEKLAKEKDKPKDDPKPDDPKPDDTKDDTPSWFKSWSQQQEQRLNQLETSKKAEELNKKIFGNPKLKDIPKKFWEKRQLPQKEEDIESFADDVITDYQEIVPSFTPGQSKGKTEDKPSKEKIEGIVNSIIPN